MAVRSCLLLAVQTDGAELSTVESLAQADGLNSLQQAFHGAMRSSAASARPGS